MDEDMRDNPSVDPTPTPAYVSTIVQAECGFSNEYTSYFPTKSLSGTDYRIAPSGLVAFVNLGVEMLETRHEKVVIELSGMRKPSSNDKGKSTDLSCYVMTGTTKA
jgi:hypothetical protein